MGEAAEEEDRGCSSGGDENWPKFGPAIYLPLFGIIKRTYFLGIFMARKRCAVNFGRNSGSGESHSMDSWTPESAPPSSVSGEAGEKKRKKEQWVTLILRSRTLRQTKTPPPPSSSFLRLGGIFPGNAATVINETLSSPSSSSSLFKLTFLRLSLVVQRF